MSDEERTTDVVVPTFDNLAELQACLASLEKQTEPPSRVLVCVDGSTDGTADYLSAYAGPLRLVALWHPDRSNRGRAAVRNLALPELRARWVLLLDSDMELDPDGVARHVALLEAGADLASIGDVVYRNADANPWARYQATRGKNKARSGEMVGPLAFNTQNVALASSDLTAVKGFDDSFVGYGGEDTELGLRVAEERGLRFVFNGRARALTTEPKTTQEGLAQLGRYARTNLHRLRARHPGPPAPYWVDHLEARDIAGRLLLASMNPLTDRIARVLEPRAPWPIRRRILDYLVLRTVWRGYLEGPR